MLSIFSLIHSSDTLFSFISHSPDLPPPFPCHLWWLGDFRVITGTVPQQQRHSGEQAVHSRTDSVGGDTGEPARRPQGMRIQRADAAPHQPQQPGEWELFLVWVK